MIKIIIGTIKRKSAIMFQIVVLMLFPPWLETHGIVFARVIAMVKVEIVNLIQFAHKIQDLRLNLKNVFVLTLASLWLTAHADHVERTNNIMSQVANLFVETDIIKAE